MDVSGHIELPSDLIQLTALPILSVSSAGSGFETLTTGSMCKTLTTEH